MARKAGIKSISEDCHDLIRHLIDQKLHEVINAVNIINNQNNTKTIMSSDVYDGLKLLNHNVTKSDDLVTNSSTNKFTVLIFSF